MTLEFGLDFEIENDVFQDDRNTEMARILQEVAGRLLRGETGENESGLIRDANGNAIGNFGITDTETEY